MIPYRQIDNETEVLLITSRRQKRWIIPKGIVEPGLTAAASAANEVWEEAGVRGWLHPFSVGIYNYRKWHGTCQVEVFLMSVEEILDHWPEETFRSRQWFSCKEAAMHLREPMLKIMVSRLPSLFCESLGLVQKDGS